MNYTLRDPKEFFNAHVPKELQQDIVRAVLRGYVDANDEIRFAEYQQEEAHDLFPYVRRCRIDRYLRQLSMKHPEVDTRAELNTARNSYHTYIRSGDVMLTASVVDRPTDLAREAQFRNEYAGRQTRFDVDAERNTLKVMNSPPPLDGLLYGIILHGPDKENRTLPAFIRVAFPDRCCSSYIDHVDLDLPYAEVVEEMWLGRAEVVADEAEVKLRDAIRTRQSQGRLL